MSDLIESDGPRVPSVSAGETAFLKQIENDEEEAYSAKDMRSTAAAKRLVDEIAAEASVYGTTDLESHSVSGKRLLAAYAIYPEVFIKLFDPSQPEKGLNYQEFPKAVSKIFQNGGLSLYNILGYNPKDGAEILDKKAGVIESATESLLVYPPSQDFLEDHDLGRKYYLGGKDQGSEFRVTVKNVTDLLTSVDYLDKEIGNVSRKYSDMLKLYEEFDTYSDTKVINSKLDLLRNMLHDVVMYFPLEYKEYAEIAKVDIRTAINSDNSTLGELKLLYMNCASLALWQLKSVRDKKQNTFDAVISGEASTYATSDKKTSG